MRAVDRRGAKVNNRSRWRVLAAAAAMVATGCGMAGGEADPPATPTTTAATTSDPVTTPTAGSSDEPPPAPTTPATGTTAPGAETSTPLPTPDFSGPSAMPADDLVSHLVARARADVQTRVKPAAPITALRVQQAPLRDDTLTWCRDHGVEVADPGFLAVMQSGDRVWVYLAGGDAVPVLCPTDEADGGTGFVPPPGPDD